MGRAFGTPAPWLASQPEAIPQDKTTSEIEVRPPQQGPEKPASNREAPKEPEPARAAAAAMPQLLTMAADAQGHVSVLQLLEEGSPSQRAAIAQRLRSTAPGLARNKHGCRVLQSAVELAPREAQVTLALELKGSVADCSRHLFGNFVVQKCVEQLPAEAIDFIIQELEDQAVEASLHIYACRVIQRLLEHCQHQQLEKLVGKLLAAVPRLAADQYGNNVLRQLLQHGSAEWISRVADSISKNVLEVARCRYSSLVLEKCLAAVSSGEHAKALQPQRALLMAALLGRPGESSPPLQQIMLDRFGNYIAQRAIACSRGPEREQIQQLLRAAEARLKRSANGRHILVAMRREFSHA